MVLRLSISGALLAMGLCLSALAAPALAAKQSAMVIDANSGQVLHNDDGDELRHPASLTKMMTLYLVFETINSGRLSLSDKVRISDTAAEAPPSKLGLDAGDEISVRDAVRVLITKSANDIAIALAEKVGGSEKNFVRLMNARARDLGMSKSNFENASGLPDRDQVTTARDMITLGLRLQDDFPEYYPMFATRSFSYAGRSIRNHNTLMNSFAGIDGIKTGYTRMSGFNLVSSVRRNGRHLVAAVFGGSSAASRNAEMRGLLVRAMTRASPTKTRKPSGPLIAKLQLAPKIAERPAAKPQRIAAAEPTPQLKAEPRLVKPFAAPKPAAAPVAKTIEPATVAKASPAKAAATAPAPVVEPIVVAEAEPEAPAVTDAARVVAADPDAPIEVFKVKRVTIQEKAVKTVDPDMSTDMDDEADAEALRPFLQRASAEDPSTPIAVDFVAKADASENLTVISKLERSPLPGTADQPALINTASTAIVAQPSAKDEALAMLGGPKPQLINTFAGDGAPSVAPSPLKAKKTIAAAAVPSIKAVIKGLAPSSLQAQAKQLPSPNKGGGVAIQIGAYPSMSEAQQALAAAQSKAAGALSGAAAQTPSLQKDGRTLYRARFSGLDASRAASACSELRRKSIDCLVMAQQ